MTHEHKSQSDPDQPVHYQIRLQGQLEQQWQSWFEDMTIAVTADGETILTGPVVDQAALHGLLKKVRDLAMPLLAVNRVDTASTSSSIC